MGQAPPCTFPSAQAQPASQADRQASLKKRASHVDKNTEGHTTKTPPVSLTMPASSHATKHTPQQVPQPQLAKSFRQTSQRRADIGSCQPEFDHEYIQRAHNAGK